MWQQSVLCRKLLVLVTKISTAKVVLFFYCSKIASVFCGSPITCIFNLMKRVKKLGDSCCSGAQPLPLNFMCTLRKWVRKLTCFSNNFGERDKNQTRPVELASPLLREAPNLLLIRTYLFKIKPLEILAKNFSGKRWFRKYFRNRRFTFSFFFPKTDQLMNELCFLHKLNILWQNSAQSSKSTHSILLKKRKRTLICHRERTPFCLLLLQPS